MYYKAQKSIHRPLRSRREDRKDLYYFDFQQDPSENQKISSCGSKYPCYLAHLFLPVGHGVFSWLGLLDQEKEKILRVLSALSEAGGSISAYFPFQPWPEAANDSNDP